MPTLSLREYFRSNGFDPTTGISHFLPNAVGGSVRYLFTNKDRLLANEQLQLHAQIVSMSRLFNLIMQSNGNLALYRTHFGRALWASGTNGRPVDYVVMRADGDFAAYSQQGTQYWDAGTDGHPNASVVVQDDGNLVVYDSLGRPLWASNTVQDLSSPTIQYADSSGYRYDETAEWWKQDCMAFPCFGAIQWPGYATQVIEDAIDGKPVVIQLWKGTCQKFAGLQEFPGGIGAEVGVYHRIPGRARPTSLPFLPPPFAQFILDSIAHLADDQLWWAFPELSPKIEFTLINPVTGQPFFSAGAEVTYWLNKWMDDDSYERYQSDHVNQTPSDPTEYSLEYVINGKNYSPW